MLKEKLGRLHQLRTEINQWEEEQANSKTNEKQQKCARNLSKLRAERGRLITEDLLGDAQLTPFERVVANSHYYQGKTWEYAIYDAVDTLSPAKQDDYYNNIEKYVESIKKSLSRKLSKSS